MPPGSGAGVGPRVAAVVAAICFIVSILILTGCANFSQVAEELSPIAKVALEEAGATQGIPPTDTAAAFTAFSNLWGMIASAQAGQPAAQGASTAAAGQAIAAAVPAGSSNAATIALLTAAANQLGAKLPTPKTGMIDRKERKEHKDLEATSMPQIKRQLSWVGGTHPTSRASGEQDEGVGINALSPSLRSLRSLRLTQVDRRMPVYFMLMMFEIDYGDRNPIVATGGLTAENAKSAKV